MNTTRKQNTKWYKFPVMILALMLMTVSLSGVTYASETPVRVVVDGEKYPIEETTPYSEGGITWVPLRFVSEKMGAKLVWDPTSKKIGIHKGDIMISLTVGSATAIVNGETVQLDSPVIQKQGITMIPLRFVSEQLKVEVSWVPDFGEVNIFTTNKDTLNLDPYGRKIRTTNLPKNYQEYPYILEDIPNAMYEMEKKFAEAFGYTPPAAISKKDPEVTKEHIDIWMSHVVKYGDLVLNVDYNTIGSQWANDIAPHILEQSKGSVTGDLNDYVEWVKENKIKIEGYIQPEPSMIFYDNWFYYYARSKVKFRITSFKESKDLLYNTKIYRDQQPLKKNIWYTGYVDIRMFTNVSGVWGETLKVSSGADMLRYSNVRELKK